MLKNTPIVIVPTQFSDTFISNNFEYFNLSKIFKLGRHLISLDFWNIFQLHRMMLRK